ncbi:hypothetical protein AWC38_SpisGene12467 [Stylophora pistillata]|uniref:Uncharacterized protein n=1 Tax=Stylophora pistillata TaxID=50429 RepID=A0A2B4S1R3_STYPI|nr:hypothetical protein AWC38_SpisGene12467 [Stylophora pistillata]
MVCEASSVHWDPPGPHGVSQGNTQVHCHQWSQVQWKIYRVRVAPPLRHLSCGRTQVLFLPRQRQMLRCHQTGHFSRTCSLAWSHHTAVSSPNQDRGQAAPELAPGPEVNADAPHGSAHASAVEETAAESHAAAPDVSPEPSDGVVVVEEGDAPSRVVSTGGYLIDKETPAPSGSVKPDLFDESFNSIDEPNSVGEDPILSTVTSLNNFGSIADEPFPPCWADASQLEDDEMPRTPVPFKISASEVSSDGATGLARPSRSPNPRKRSSKKAPGHHSIRKGVTAAARLATSQGVSKKK